MSYERTQPASSAMNTYEASSSTHGSGTFIGTTVNAIKERAPVDAALNILQDRLENMERLISSVEVRFEPAMRPSVPTPGDPAPPLPLHAQSGVGSIISERCEQIRRLEWRIESLLSRCEL